LYHLIGPYKDGIAIVMDGLLATFLFASFVYGVYNVGQNQGACALPKKIGVWDNTRGCTRMTVAASFSAVNFATFLASSVLTALL
jgi:hypothetical protein